MPARPGDAILGVCCRRWSPAAQRCEIPWDALVASPSCGCRDGRPLRLWLLYEEADVKRNRTTERLCLGWLALSIAACETPELNEAQPIQQEIYHGTPVSIPAATGVVMLLDGSLQGCTGTVYRRYWIMTAAHSFDGSLDGNGDGTITAAEGAGRYAVSNLVDDSGAVRRVGARAIYRFPTSAWGAFGGPDAAMVFVDPSTTGAGMNYLAANTGNYSNGTLNIYQGETQPNLLDATVLAYGYAPTIAGGPMGTLNSAQKRIARVFDTAYEGGVIANAGTSCAGDSGGPDFMFDGSKYVVTGIHSTSSNGCANNGNDFQYAAKAWRSWIAALVDASVVVTDCGSVRTPAAEDLLLFEHNKFGGRCWRLNVQSPPATGRTGSLSLVGNSLQVPIWDDAISSALIGSNVKNVSFYRDAAFGALGGSIPGTSCTSWFTGPNASDRYRGDPGFGGVETNSNPCITNFNDALSSLVMSLN